MQYRDYGSVFRGGSMVVRLLVSRIPWHVPVAVLLIACYYKFASWIKLIHVVQEYALQYILQK